MATDKNLIVWRVTDDLFRSLALTTIFGNPGSTEQPMLKNFPLTSNTSLHSQEASAIAMADDFAQATGCSAQVNLYTSGGTGSGMGNIMTAFQNKTPLIITAEIDHEPHHLAYVTSVDISTTLVYATRISHYPEMKWSMDIGTGDVIANAARVCTSRPTTFSQSLWIIASSLSLVQGLIWPSRLQ